MNPDKYIAEVSRIISTNFSPMEVEVGMTAARAGLLTLQVLHMKPITAGFQKFSDVLRVLNDQGMINLAKNAKGVLAIWPSDKKPAEPLVDTKPAPIGPATPKFAKLRNPLWLAFIADSPVGRRFMHKRTGEIRLGQAEVPEPSDEWAEIKPLDQEIERSDARAFLRTQGRENEVQLNEAVNSDTWSRNFSYALKNMDPFLAAEWNRRRSLRVVNRAEEWRRANGIEPELVYIKPPVVLPSVAPHAGERDSRLRDALISAVRQMRTEELLELRLPAKHLVLALCPELLNR